MVHTLRRSIDLSLPRDRVFPFFAAAENLARITPPDMGFVIRSPSPITMARGTVIEYTVRVFRIPVRWQSLISTWDPPHEFVDEQVRGPYARWLHRHRFTDIPGGTRIDDEVTYALPLSPLSDIAHPLVKRELRRIFDYREKAVRRLLEEGGLDRR